MPWPLVWLIAFTFTASQGLLHGMWALSVQAHERFAPITAILLPGVHAVEGHTTVSAGFMFLYGQPVDSIHMAVPPYILPHTTYC